MVNTVYTCVMIKNPTSLPKTNQIETLHLSQNLLQSCDALLITAGAGMGIDSGLPDFRGNDGFWKEFPSLKLESIKFPDIASPLFFYTDPYMCWAFYGYRYDMYSQVDPHNGFFQLLEFAKQKKDGYFVYTSNVDGHFQKAGYPEERVVECHGSIKHFQCLDGHCGHVWSDDEVYFAVDISCLELLNDPPRCPICRKMSRPSVLMFDDGLWNQQRYTDQKKRMKEWLEDLDRKQSKIVVLEIGSGQTVPTVRDVGEGIAQEYEARFIRINPDRRDSVSPDLSIQMGAERALKLVLPAV